MRRGSYRFSRSNRLIRSYQFRNLWASRTRLEDDAFLVFVLENKMEIARLGMVVPKRCIKKASRRHYVKRLLREHFRLNQHRLEGLDVLIVVKKYLEMNYIECDKRLNKYWQVLAP